MGASRSSDLVVGTMTLVDRHAAIVEAGVFVYVVRLVSTQFCPGLEAYLDAGPAGFSGSDAIAWLEARTFTDSRRVMTARYFNDFKAFPATLHMVCFHASTSPKCKMFLSIILRRAPPAIATPSKGLIDIDRVHASRRDSETANSAPDSGISVRSSWGSGKYEHHPWRTRRRCGILNVE
jgi:hypothetical protein